MEALDKQGTMGRLKSLSTTVNKLCSASLPSPVVTARTHLEIENDMLALRLLRNQLSRKRGQDYYKAFRDRRWEGDITQNYNEAAAGANADMTDIDHQIADVKAYISFLENLTSILKSFTTSCRE